MVCTASSIHPSTTGIPWYLVINTFFVAAEQFLELDIGYRSKVSRNAFENLISRPASNRSLPFPARNTGYLTNKIPITDTRRRDGIALSWRIDISFPRHIQSQGQDCACFEIELEHPSNAITVHPPSPLVLALQPPPTTLTTDTVTAEHQ